MHRNFRKMACFVVNFCHGKGPKDLQFFVNKVIIITKWREVGKSRELRCERKQNSHKTFLRGVRHRNFRFA